jgi:uncharacterized membrane protein YeaQ/YmgE (transglycosylase-associated protein family)
MAILGWILFGFVVGLLARAIMPGRDPLGLIGTTVLGIVGALLAGWFGQAVGWYTPGSGAGFVSATIGAIVVLALYHLATGRKAIGGGSRSSGEDDFTKAA